MEREGKDSGLDCLSLLLRFHQIAVDTDQIRHQFSGEAIGVTEMLRCAKDLKLKARAVTTTWAGLMKLPLPAIVELKDKSFFHRRQSDRGRRTRPSPFGKSSSHHQTRRV
jgi:subfamily B ATP-binding cassette protein HlyB/CyaB